jgi:selenide,water dikinase
MAKYGEELPFDKMKGAMAAGAMGGSSSSSGASGGMSLGPEYLAMVAASRMRCGGCGGKVGASTLERALLRVRRLQQEQQQGQQQQESGQQGPSMNGSSSTAAAGAAPALIGLAEPDDAAVLAPPPAGHLLLQSVDFFKAVVDDPYVFGW